MNLHQDWPSTCLSPSPHCRRWWMEDCILNLLWIVWMASHALQTHKLSSHFPKIHERHLCWYAQCLRNYLSWWHPHLLRLHRTSLQACSRSTPMSQQKSFLCWSQQMHFPYWHCWIPWLYSTWWSGPLLRMACTSSVATVMTDVFHKNEINLLRKFGKIVRIFDKIDDSKNRGVI